MNQSPVRALENEGYVIFKNYFHADVVARLRNAAARTKRKVLAQPGNFMTRYTHRTEGMVDTWGVHDLFAPPLYEPEYGQLLSQSGLLQIIQELLNTKELRFWAGSLLWSPQFFNYELYWHRDGYDMDVFEPSGKPNHVQFNVPLYEDRSFILIPGSHKRPLTPEEANAVQRKDNASTLTGQIEVACEPGDVLFTNAWVLHRGTCSTRTPRMTLHINLQPADEPFGGHASRPWMSDLAHLDRMPVSTRDLFLKLVQWDEAHPLSPQEQYEAEQAFQEILNHQAGVRLARAIHNSDEGRSQQ